MHLYTALGCNFQNWPMIKAADYAASVASKTFSAAFMMVQSTLLVRWPSEYLHLVVVGVESAVLVMWLCNYLQKAVVDVANVEFVLEVASTDRCVCVLWNCIVSKCKVKG